MTGSRGPTSKPDDRRQRRNKPASPLVFAKGDIDLSKIPTPREGMLRETVDNWNTYWRSDLALTVRRAQIPMVRRLFDRYDERERSFRLIRSEGRLTKGSQGQLVAHPLLKYIDACDAEIRQLEDRLGLSPKGFASLGSAVAGAANSLDELNRKLSSDDEADELEEDPRVLPMGERVR